MAAKRHAPPFFLQNVSECFADQVLILWIFNSEMDPQDEASSDKSWLDQYPVEVLEAVLEILKSQECNQL